MERIFESSKGFDIDYVYIISRGMLMAGADSSRVNG